MRFKKQIIVVAVLAILLYGILWRFIGTNNLINYFIVIFAGSVLLALIIVFYLAFNIENYSWLVETEENLKILELKMNLSLAATLALFGFGLSLAISILTDVSFLVKEALIIASLISVFMGLFFGIGVIARRNKLMVLYMQEKNKK